MTQTRREVASELAEEILADIELSRIPAAEVLKKTSRLARLLDDTEALKWLNYEMHGYPSPLGPESAAAADRSGRQVRRVEGDNGPSWRTTSLTGLQADVDTGTIQLRAAVDGNISVSSANPNQFMHSPPGNTRERSQIRKFISDQQTFIGKVVGAIHAYVAEREIELRFGAAVESAFGVVRDSVDARIAKLAPVAAVKFAAAFENASSDNPEHWANAASECRRLLKELADSLRPAGDPVNSRPMTDAAYINRLVDWIVAQKSIGTTLKNVIKSDLEDIGKRIDAADSAGHKGAHESVTRYEASRTITGTYLLVGDILSLADGAETETPTATAVDQ